MANWEDYVDFDVDAARDMLGDAAFAEVEEQIELTLQTLFENIELADSDAEREMALAELEDFRYSSADIEEVLADAELEILTEYMSGSYKDDQDRIDRYLYLTGQGRFAKGAKDIPAPIWEL